jgi:hypothetical protein
MEEEKTLVLYVVAEREKRMISLSLLFYIVTLLLFSESKPKSYSAMTSPSVS